MASRHYRAQVIAILIYSLFISQNLAQVQRQDCMDELRPCLAYLNNNNRPPDSCCQPLDYIIRSMPECLCSLMSNHGANQAEQAGINITQAQTLPGRCGQHINPLGCVVGTPDTSSTGLRFRSLSSFADVVICFGTVLMILGDL